MNMETNTPAGQPLRELEIPAKAPALLEALLANWKQVAAGIGVILLAVLAVAVYRGYQQKNLEAAENELGMILTQKEGAERLVALDNFLAKVPAAARGAVLLELAKTSMEQGQYKKAAEAFGELSRLAGPGMDAVAVLGAAAAQAQAGEWAQAAATLKAAKDKMPETFMIPYNRQLAVYAEQGGDYPLALSAYEKLRELGKGATSAYFDAKIAEIKGKMSATPAKPAS